MTAYHILHLLLLLLFSIHKYRQIPSQETCYGMDVSSNIKQMSMQQKAQRWDGDTQKKGKTHISQNSTQ
jgi:hypothetical protein